MKMKEIQRVSLTDEVVNQLRDMISNGDYKPGEKLPTEAVLCDSFGVSRTTIREAMRILQTLGFVENRPGKGAFVADRSTASVTLNGSMDYQFKDYMQVRMAVELFAVRIAVEKASDKDIKKLEEIHTSFLKANTEKDMVSLISLDELFHSTIVRITDNNLLIEINKQLLKAFRRYRGKTFTNETTYLNAIEPHQRILDCFRKHDSAQAVEEMRNHLEITKRDMETLYNSQQH